MEGKISASGFLEMKGGKKIRRETEGLKKVISQENIISAHQYCLHF